MAPLKTPSCGPLLTIIACIVLSNLAVASNEAAHDFNYYAANRVNPNVHHKMYYAESSNVLQSLTNFDKLYVSFSSCVWSTYQPGNGDSCGVETDDAYWYMGATECFRANAAFSLYGVLKGHKDKGCSSANFINSFFTTTGVEAFTQSVVQSGQVSFSASGSNNAYPGGVTSVCHEGGNSNQNNRVLGDNYGTVTHNTKYSDGQTSYGLACDGKKFAIKTFDEPFCDSSASQKVTDSLSTFNSDIHQAQCIEIYSSSSSSNNNQDRQNGENGPLSLLYNSQTCSIREFPALCPDPHFKLRRYAAAEERAMIRTYSTKESRTIRAISILLLVLGCMLLLLAALIYLRRSRLSRLRTMRKRIMKRRAKNKKSKDQRRGGSSGWFSGERSRSTKNSSHEVEKHGPPRRGFLFGRNRNKE